MKSISASHCRTSASSAAAFDGRPCFKARSATFRWTILILATTIGTLQAADRVNLLGDPEDWEAYSAKEKVRQTLRGGTLRVRSRDGRGRVVYRQQLPLPGARIHVDLRFVDPVDDETAGGLIFEGAASPRGSPLTLNIRPLREELEIGGETTRLRLLEEDPYHYDLRLVFNREKLTVFWGGHRVAATPVQFRQVAASPGVFATGGNVAISSFAFQPERRLAADIRKERTYEPMAVNLTPESMTQLRSGWVEYFGTHYSHDETEVGIRFRTVRSYGGTHVGIDPPDERQRSPVRIGPFSGRRVRVSLDDFRSQSRFARNPPTARDLVPEILRQGATAIYLPNTFYMSSAEEPAEIFDKDLGYWSIRLIHEAFPRSRRHIVWQLGNEIVGGHWNPRRLTKEQMRRRADARSAHRGYDMEWKLNHYINSYVAPAVETIRCVGRDLYGDPDALTILSGSMNPYTRENNWWLRELMTRRFDGPHAPALNGEPVWRYLDILTVHYVAPAFDKLRRFVRDYLRTGKVSGIWITEDHGRAGRGPVTIFQRGLSFMRWVAADDLNARQARLCWWGEGPRAGGSGAELMTKLGLFLGGRPLYLGHSTTLLAEAERQRMELYALADAPDAGASRILLVFWPERDTAALDIGTLTLGFPGEKPMHPWSIAGVQYATLARPHEIETKWNQADNRLNITLNRRVTEPFALYLRAIPPEQAAREGREE